ncbi:uncharacterized protein LOC110733232 [Chenopodium quinoa]|uniref:uncharacterized protein LOC110733232 n=1 Tax=Chenopodium quinoa TaxID=63459 RepID=UPI000B797F0C|nr:uncharacterized protein LOC110733232 [Chenopodium quinoa]
MDKLGFWNIRGLNKDSKLCDVLWFIRHHGVGLFGLLETKVKVGKFGDVFSRLGSDWSLIHVYVAHKATRFSFDCTMIVELSNKITGPWILQGDFNSVLNLNDRIGSTVSLAEEGKDRVCSKIDKVIANNEWMLKFADMQATFFLKGIMDHSPCVINLFDSGNHTKKPFRFVNIWVDSPDFLPGVMDVWCKMVSSTPMFQCVRKMKEVKQFLKESKMGRFSCVEVDDVIAEKHLEDIQIMLQSDPGNEELISQERLARIQFAKTQSNRFNFLKQKAKVHWLKDDPGQVCDAFLQYYQGILGIETQMNGNIHHGVISKGKVLSEDQGINICSEFCEHDVKRALWSIEDDKALGSDGLSNKFFSRLPGALLVLISLKMFWISLVQIISKIICDRLKEVLPELIDGCQGAFVSGRSILDNILICQDMLKANSNKRKPPRCTIKVDLRKAYDSVNWRFIHEMLSALNFPSKFIS